MRNLITVLAIVFCTTCFSQKIYIKKGSDKTHTTIKIEFPKEYNLMFYRNEILIKSMRFKGIKKFTIEDFEQLEFAYKNNKKTESFELYFIDELEKFKDDLILENQMDY